MSLTNVAKLFHQKRVKEAKSLSCLFGRIPSLFASVRQCVRGKTRQRASDLQRDSRVMELSLNRVSLSFKPIHRSTKRLARIWDDQVIH